MEIITIVGIILCFIAWMMLVYFTLKLVEESKTKQQIRGYRKENDKGIPKEEAYTKGKPRSDPARDKSSKARKRKLQNALKHAKRELLSS